MHDIGFPGLDECMTNETANFVAEISTTNSMSNKKKRKVICSNCYNCVFGQENFKSGCRVQLISRSSGKPLQYLNGTLNGLGTEGSGDENKACKSHCIRKARDTIPVNSQWYIFKVGDFLLNICTFRDLTTDVVIMKSEPLSRVLSFQHSGQ